MGTNYYYEIVERKKEYVDFYCDKCGEKIGTSVAYDDGYYEEIGEKSMRIGTVDDYMFEKHGDWCEKNCDKNDAEACWRKLFEGVANE